MGVFTEMWWSVRWPWMLLWLLTAAGAGALIVLTVARLMRRRRSRARNITYSICFYLHDRSVMDHYQMRGYAAALRKEVEQRTSDSKDGTIRASVFGIGAGAGRRDNSEIVSKYMEVAEPISVIGVIMDVLEQKDVIVHVDLVNGTVRRNAALTRALTDHARAGDPPQSSVRLRDVEDFVLIRGRFRRSSRADGSTVLLAPYGDPDDLSQGPRVRVTCATEGLRTEVPSGTFSARCLGKVQDWNSEEAVLEVQAMAIFR
ncbi:hypothetical protein [Streptomyces sp. Tu 2975]|uniref:hypothetical protein n=1 Tax=Streptomyces sp. Tu 2975 TaxID=2676871 RepID=UPI001FCA3F18|nr:hypothetical protein [Streptomyces sp. Tu 2975]